MTMHARRAGDGQPNTLVLAATHLIGRRAMATWPLFAIWAILCVSVKAHQSALQSESGRFSAVDHTASTPRRLLDSQHPSWFQPEGSVPPPPWWATPPPPPPSPPGAGLGSVNASHGIDYHGGVVVFWPLTVYLIMYGNWSDQPDLAPRLGAFIKALNGSAWLRTVTTYWDDKGHFATPYVNYGGVAYDEGYSQGRNLSAPQVAEIVRAAQERRDIPIDSGAVYAVVSSRDVAETDFCTSACGWHDFNQSVGMHAFVGDGWRCPDQCVWQKGEEPNGPGSLDPIANILAHELTEVITNPYLDAWYDDSDHLEGADKCLWQFGAEWTAPDGALANMMLGGRPYLIQMLWSNSGTGECVQGTNATVIVASS